VHAADTTTDLFGVIDARAPPIHYPLITLGGTVRPRTAITSLGIGIALALGAATPAQAATYYTWTSPTTYGYATFTSTTGALTVYDTYGDSRRVIAEVWNSDTITRLTTAQDANGNNGTPGTTTYARVTPGDRVFVIVCRQDGSDPDLRDACDSQDYTI
jgi:hypothetical protein